jgi:restriction system protein
VLDFSQIFMTLIQTLFNAWYFVALIIFFKILRTPFIKGKLGEFFVKLILDLKLNKSQYKIMHNITLPTGDGTTQIDHIIVSPYGVFVIETKNMKGWIFGSEEQATWTQTLYKHTTKFQNPLRQNYKHTKTIESSLTLDPEVVFSIVVFVGNSTFKTDMPDNVTYAGGVVDYINTFSEIIIEEEKIDWIVTMIQNEQFQNSRKTDKAHVEHIKKIIGQDKQINQVITSVDWICPKCNSALIERTAKRGQNKGNTFLGCSNFPKCRFTK